MRDTDDSIINLLLEGTKQFEIKVKSYDYWELYAKQYKDLGNRVGDSIAKNTPSEIIYAW